MLYESIIYIIIMEFAMKKFKVINPIARTLKGFRKQIVLAKKGKGSYNRKKEKCNAKD
jgi:stalled ribosome alternative rescue factor ArfA|tara:strand:+ start:71 stop:244 length:174 start_codon:yes stop_codon:yes gene_type:complete